MHNGICLQARRCSWRVGLSVLLGLTLPASTVEAQVRWRAGTSAPSGRSQADFAAVLSQPGLRGAHRHIVLQFLEPMRPDVRAELAAAGVSLTGYLGDNAFFASVAPGAVDAGRAAAVNSLVDVQDVQTAWKINPRIAGATPPGWAVIPAPAERVRDAAGPWIPVYILFHGDVAPDAARSTAAACGVEVRGQLASVNGLVAEMPFALVQVLAADDAVQYIEPALPALVGVNDSNRAITQANVVQAPPYGLDGSGVSVLVYDAGTARATHVDFQGRLHARDASGMIDHATHVSGTIGGGGVANPQYRGMAPGVTLESYGYEQVGGLHQGFLYTDPGDLEADYNQAINLYGVDIANNSIGTNTSYNGFPCDWEGDYGVTDTLIDAIVRGSLGTPFRIVWANGNERGSGRCGTGYHTTAPPACAKNHITVGAMNSNDDSVTYFTSWGPADDGRLKPDISGPGCQIGSDGGVTSCDSTSDTAYTTFCGTSMASPTVCGLSALLLQDYRVQFPASADPRNSTLKALLAHNATDLGLPGPDYQTGYGSVRIQDTIDFLRAGSFFEDTLDAGQSRTVTVAVGPGDTALRVTLAWDDPPGTPNVIPALVNDLDLRVLSPTGTPYFPWTLGGLADPAAPAVRSVADHVNNLEHVLVDLPEPGIWTVEIVGYNIPQGPQPFSVCVSPHYAPDCNTNGVDDLQDIAGGTSADCNTNSIPDECESAADCNSNGIRDICDIAAGTSADVNANRIADECETDCNTNGRPDDYDLATGASADCNTNAVPDECDLAGGTSHDCSGNGVPDECELDCNRNGVSDDCDVSAGTSTDCDANGVPDECETDCNANGIADACDISAGTSADANLNGFPDECHRLYVNDAAGGARTGWSWAGAERDLRTALTLAATNSDIDEIWVAAGSYEPDAPGGNRSATFTLRSGLRVYGGFAGGETDAAQRDWRAHETILSGDLNGDDTPDWTHSGENSMHVITAQDVDATGVLDGFTIRGGYAVNEGGTGIALTNCQMQIANCLFSRNLVNFTHGGAVFASGGRPVFVNCAFDGNYAHLGKGGAVYLYSAAGATFDRCTFTNNTSVGSTNGTPEAAGAAIAHWGAGPLNIRDSVFDTNVSRGFYASGSNGAYAGAIDHFGPGPLAIERCAFTNNWSNQGGAIFTWKDATITNSIFAGNHAPQFNSSVGWGGQGGAVGCQSYAGSTVTVTNCVFYGNNAEDAGGIGAYGAAILTLSNSILWGNTDNRGNVGKSQVNGGSVSYSCIMNMLVAAPGDDPPDPANFPHCTAADPSFAAPAADDFRVSSGSPCIDAGANAAVSFGTTRDLDGRYRFLDDPATPDTGSGAPPMVDMGAYEFGAVPPGDFDGDGHVDLFDYTVLYACMTGPNAGPVVVACEPFDTDGDTDVDLADAAAFQALFDGGAPPLDPPALVQGTITYGGAATGLIFVRATGSGSTPGVYETTLAAPQSYQLAITQAGAYTVSAFIDTNGNAAPDPGEPAADYTANPVVVASAGQVFSGVDISLGGTYTVSGRIRWNTGGGAAGVPVQLSGAASATTTTNGNGNYSFPSLADGAYRVTPVSAGRYFYPYFRDVTVAGASVPGQNFDMYPLPTGDVDGEESGTVTAVNPGAYSLTLSTGAGPLTLHVYSGTLFSGDAATLGQIRVGWTVTAQYWTSVNLAVEIDSVSGGL